MTRYFPALLFVFSLVVCNLSVANEKERAVDSNPNIIFILADDLGFGDLGCYGQQTIKTPRLDQMASEGMRFRNFYAGCTVCAPSRCVLMTGKHMGHCHVRGNAGGNMRIQSLRPEDVTVAEILKSAGYQTALCGKWGLGEFSKNDMDNPGVPNRQGFDFFYGFQSQRHAHNYYPEFLWRNEEMEPLNNEVVQEGNEKPNELFTGGYATKRVDYSHDLVMNEAVDFIRRSKDGPFFLYVALTIPHANNEGTRGTGDGQEVPDYGIYSEKDWPNQDKGQAAMITRMDADVGRILDLLKELEIDENTIVMFSSDNGHHNEGGHNPDRFDPNGPLRGKKRHLYEGGIRVPMIVRWPGKTPAGSVTDHISYFGDLFATACEAISTEVPDSLDSVSFLPTISGQANLQSAHEHLYWEFYEQGSKQAVRKGKWKAVREPMLTGKMQLFDLEADLGEAKDVAESNPDVVAEMEAIMEREHQSHTNWKPGGKVPKNKPAPGDGKMRF